MKHRNKVDLSFRYTSAADTNIARRFAKVKRDLKSQAEREATVKAEGERKTVKLRRA